MQIDSSLAFVFPGQGSQHVGMLKDSLKHSTIVNNTLDEASNTLGFDLKEIITSDKHNHINISEYTQAIILACSYALWLEYSNKINIYPKYFVGHSLGEYTALLAAKSIKFHDALLLVQQRAKLMHKASANTGTMLAVLGLSLEKVNEVSAFLSDTSNYLEVANINTENQIIVACSEPISESAEVCFKEAGAKKVVKLPISTVSHCSIMKTISFEYQYFINKVTFDKPMTAILQNASLNFESDIVKIKDNLVKQLYTPVDWLSTIQILKNTGIIKFVECGPKNILSSLNKKILSSNEDVVSYSDYIDLNKFKIVKEYV